MRILYKSIQSYSSVEENTFFKDMGMLGPYITSIVPYCCSVVPLLLLLYPCSPHIFIIVPHNLPLIFFLCPYIIIVRSARIILWPHGLLYIEIRFCHLYHPRIVHLCNVKEVSPSKRLISKSFIYLFFYFVSWLHNIYDKGSNHYTIQTLTIYSFAYNWF